MSFVTQMLPAGQPNPGQAQIAYAEVCVPAPTGFDSQLYVILPDFDPNIPFPCVTWPVMHGGTLPAIGAACLILIDGHNQYWCVSWHGAYTPPPVALVAHSIA